MNFTLTERTEMRTKKQTMSRWAIYVLGMLVLALGLTLNTKTGLGCPPFCPWLIAAPRSGA